MNLPFSSTRKAPEKENARANTNILIAIFNILTGSSRS